jgi:hypothetical protein
MVREAIPRISIAEEVLVLQNSCHEEAMVESSQRPDKYLDRMSFQNHDRLPSRFMVESLGTVGKIPSFKLLGVEWRDRN